MEGEAWPKHEKCHLLQASKRYRYGHIRVKTVWYAVCRQRWTFYLHRDGCLWQSPYKKPRNTAYNEACITGRTFFPWWITVTPLPEQRLINFLISCIGDLWTVLTTKIRPKSTAKLSFFLFQFNLLEVAPSKHRCSAEVCVVGCFACKITCGISDRLIESAQSSVLRSYIADSNTHQPTVRMQMRRFLSDCGAVSRCISEPANTRKQGHKWTR